MSTAKSIICFFFEHNLPKPTMDSKELVSTVLLDLSKAFDLVDLSLLLSKIKKYHITNTSHQRFQSYLYNRSQRCCINGSLSDALFIAQGFPQGSILGPVLFLLCINDLPLGGCWRHYVMDYHANSRHISGRCLMHLLFTGDDQKCVCCLQANLASVHKSL